MNTSIFDLKGNEQSKIDLPEIVNFPYRPEIIKKVYVNMDSHHYQEQGRYPAAGEIVSAESRNTGLGIARLARAKGEGFSRAGQAAGVGGVRKGRLAHPPESWKVIYKKINKKEKLIALYSSISYTAIEELTKKRSGKSKRRRRSNRIGKSAIIIVGNPDSPLLNLNDSLPGINIKFIKDLSVLDFAPGCKPIRLAIFSNGAIDKLKEIKIPSNILINK